MKNKKFKKILIIIFIIIAFIGGIFAGKAIEARKYLENGSSTTTQISETTVSTQTIENTLTSSGEVTSSETEKLDLSTSKYFKTMCVEENDIVKKERLTFNVSYYIITSLKDNLFSIILVNIF